MEWQQPWGKAAYMAHFILLLLDVALETPWKHSNYTGCSIYGSLHQASLKYLGR